jgi:hypothetical protein
MKTVRQLSARQVTILRRCLYVAVLILCACAIFSFSASNNRLATASGRISDLGPAPVGRTVSLFSYSFAITGSRVVFTLDAGQLKPNGAQLHMHMGATVAVEYVEPTAGAKGTVVAIQFTSDAAVRELRYADPAYADYASFRDFAQALAWWSLGLGLACLVAALGLRLAYSHLGSHQSGAATPDRE